MGKTKENAATPDTFLCRKNTGMPYSRRIFNERSVLLELYNALNQTSYDDADELIFSQSMM